MSSLPKSNKTTINNSNLSNALHILNIMFICSSIIMMLIQISNGVSAAWPVLLPIFAMFLYAFNCRYLKKERTASSVFVINSIFTILFYILLYFLHAFSSILGGIYVFFICIISCSVSAISQLSKISFRDLIMDTDAAFIVFIICFAYSGYDKLQAEVIIFSASACVLSFTNLILARSDGKINAKSLIFIVFSMVITALLAFALGPFAGAAGEALVSIAGAVKKLLLTLLHYLELFIRWFASLFPNKSIEADYYSEEIDLNLLTSEGEDMIDFGIMPFIIMALAIIALALVFLIYLKKHKIKIALKGTSISQNEVTRKRVPFISALKKILNKLRRIIKSELFLLKNRNVPIGQYYLLVRKLKTSPSRKRLNETPREFLTRIEKEELITPVESFLFERTAH